VIHRCALREGRGGARLQNVDRRQQVALAVLLILVLGILATAFSVFRMLSDLELAPLTPEEKENPLVGVGIWIRDTLWYWDAPSSEEVVLAYQEEGLEVGSFYPIEADPGFSTSAVPKVYEEGTRFEIPSLGPDQGGRVFVFKSQRDLQVMADYYTNLARMPVFGPHLHSHLYSEGPVLVQINGELPSSQADLYRQVLEQEV
jgi:hypothetical protein